MSLFNSYNRVVLLGNLTRDIEIRNLASGTKVGEFGLAINDRIKKGDEWVDDTVFVDVTAWSKTAELIEKHTSKGKTVLIEGRLKLDRWVDKQSGQNRTKLKVVADSVTVLSGKDSDRRADSNDTGQDCPF